MFKLTIKTDNEAFSGDDLGLELSDIVNVVANQLEEGHLEGVCHDVNGNHVGAWKVTR